MKLYNQLTKKVETFNPLDPKNVKIYTCGPTVYSYAHIGNFFSYVYWDLLVRVILANGWKPNRVLNITDVGHLASDADDGEDKLEKGAKKEGKSVYEIANFYTEAFFKDFKSLNLVPPEKIAKATDFISEDIALVDRLTKKGYTYETSDGIYFDTSKFKSYADFANLDLENLKEGARVAKNSEKKHPSDFAVWKFVREGEDHAMQWDYLGRPGYPGWHLECSTIVHELLGEPIDIHTGGIDHIPVHHTNEIAQSEAAFDQKMARFWIHNNHVTIENQKVSKSLGNIYTLDDLKQRGFSPLDYKLWVLQGHYQSNRNFNFEDLAAAKNRRLAWINRIAESIQTKNPVSDFNKAEFHEIIANNLNTPEACAYIDAHFLNYDNFQFVDSYFGLDLATAAEKITDKQKAKVKAREDARKNQDYHTSDLLRDELEREGITIKDTDNGPIWQYL